MKKNLAVAACSVLAAAAIGLALATASSALTRPPESALVVGSAPFTPAQPALPAGTKLLLADGRTHPDGTGDFDHFYQLPNGARFHIWQTSRDRAQLGSKDPLTVAVRSHSVKGAQWVEATGFSGAVTTLTGTYRGLIISMSAQVPVAELIKFAESMQ